MLLSMLTSTLLFLQPTPEPTFVRVEASNSSGIEMIGERPVLFGLKETAEEMLSNLGYSPNDTLGLVCTVTVEKIYSPQQMLNIIGLKWLRKDYIVETTVCLGSGCFRGEAIRKTFVFAAFLDVENSEVPLNYKAFSKTLQASLKEAMKFDDRL